MDRSQDDLSNTLVDQTSQRHDVDEQRYLDEVINSFRQHATFARAYRHGHQLRIRNLPGNIQRLLPPALNDELSKEYKERKELAEKCEVCNQYFFDCMLSYAGVETSQQYQQRSVNNSIQLATEENVSKTYSVLKSLSREWSLEGRKERQQCYEPVLNAIKKYVKPKSKVCVPGSGLGRLAVEICSLRNGYCVQGNEFGFHMLLCSDFILNSCSTSRQFIVHPYFEQGYRNSNSHADVYRSVAIPDIDPSAFVLEGDQQIDFSMAAGDFGSIYSERSEHGRWGCVACSFFLDAAPCIVEYLNIIYEMLHGGGYLISFGPLHYHWSGPNLKPGESESEYRKKHAHLDERYLTSIDLCWDDVRQVMMNIGFKIIEEEVGIKAWYTRDCHSFQNTEYQCAFIVAQK